ncbi:MAG: hypothetical protein ACC707_15440 [Thiohalomonadales bacterium]
MGCSINGIKFDKSSLDALHEIDQLTNLSALLTGVLAGGSIFSIFAGAKAGIAADNIRKTDFALLANAIRSVPNIYKKRVSEIAQWQYMRHYGNEREFWKAAIDGC